MINNEPGKENGANEKRQLSSTLQCNICLGEKDEFEFKNMAKYGCTCKTAHFCKACIFDWIERNATDGRADLANWTCPCCRTKPTLAKNEPTSSTLPTPRNRLWEETGKLDQLHREWCDEYSTPPFPTTPLFDYATTTEFGIFYYDAHVRVCEYNNQYYAAVIFVNQPSWFMKKKLNVSGSLNSSSRAYYIVKAQCYAHLKKISELLSEHCSFNQTLVMYNDFNAVRDGAELLAQIDNIHALPNHARDPINMIIILFHEYIESSNMDHAFGRNPIYTFKEYYLLMSQ